MDDLVKRLRELECKAGCGSMKVCVCAYALDAADHIEELALKLLAAEGQAADNLERADRAEALLKEAVEALRTLIGACDEGRMIPRPGSGAGGMTIDANIRGSIYTGVPAWPVEEARATLARIEAAQEGKE